MRAKTPTIASQMMKGPRYGQHAKGSTEESRDEFLAHYAALIEIMAPYFPRGTAATAAVIVKCAIKYDLERAIAFGKAVRHGNFNGLNDPVHLLYSFLVKSAHKHDTVEIHRRAITAARAACEGRTLTELRPANADIFDWTIDWEPDLKNKPKPIEYKRK